MFIYYYIFEIYDTCMFEKFGQFAAHNEHFDVHVWQLYCSVERRESRDTNSMHHWIIWTYLDSYIWNDKQEMWIQLWENELQVLE